MKNIKPNSKGHKWIDFLMIMTHTIAYLLLKIIYNWSPDNMFNS